MGIKNRRNYLSLPQFKQIFPKVDLFIFDWRHSQVKDEKWTRPSRRLLVDSHQKVRAAPTSWLGLIQIDYCAFCDNYWLHCHLGLLLWCMGSHTQLITTDHVLCPRHHSEHQWHRWQQDAQGISCPGGGWTMIWWGRRFDGGSPGADSTRRRQPRRVV